VGGTALGLMALLLIVYLAFKWWERRRFYAALEMARISVADLHAQMSGGQSPVIVDVRSPTAQGIDLRRIPGALHVPLQEVERHMGELPRDSEIVLYCNCPNEASAAQAARVLLNHGFHRVRPLGGGLDAWVAAGFSVEEIAPSGVASITGGEVVAAVVVESTPASEGSNVVARQATRGGANPPVSSA
jgi:rhodanese-related sulfurtransferase